jgi:predicted O-methyltransferase YrrM
MTGSPQNRNSPIRHEAAWEYCENFHPEDDILREARRQGHELGCIPIGPGGGAALRLLTGTLDARSVVEIGTGAGVSGLWLLSGMRPDGVLTTIDTETEHQRAARENFTAAGFATNRVRMIAGPALEVLPRLSDGGYDLVFCDADKTEYGEYLTAALRLLRPGGVVVFDNALWSAKVADPAQRDSNTVAIRELGRQVRNTEGLISAMLPVGDGLLVGVRHP